MPMTFRCGTMFCLDFLPKEQTIYTKGDGDYGSAFTIAFTPSSPDLGGDDDGWGRFEESSGGQSFVVLAPRWTQDETDWTIFGVMVRFEDTWPPSTVDILLMEILSGGVVQAAMYLEAGTGNVILVDSTGATAVTIGGPGAVDRTRSYVAAVQLKDSGDSKLWRFATNGGLQSSGTGTGNDFKTGTNLELSLRLQGQNHGGSPVGSPTATLMMNPFVFDGSTAPATDRPPQIAGLFWVCIDPDATPPFFYIGTPGGQVGTAGVWSDTDDQVTTTFLKYDSSLDGGMNVMDGPLGDSRLDGSTKIWGAGVCFHSDSGRNTLNPNNGYTDVSAGRYPGSGSVLDRVSLMGATYGGDRNSHGTILIVDNLVYDDQIAFGHRTNNLFGPESELNAARGWALVDPSTLVLPTGIVVLRRRIEGHA